MQQPTALVTESVISTASVTHTLLLNSNLLQVKHTLHFTFYDIGSNTGKECLPTLQSSNKRNLVS